MTMEKSVKQIQLSVDDILTHVGEYGKFQKLLTLLFFLICIPMSYPIVFMYFSSFEPAWKCKHNSSTCNYTGTFESTDRRKCELNRTDWEYTKPETYSFVTQFDIHCDEIWMVNLARSISFVGWGTGAVILGWFGDKYGRKTVLAPSIISTLCVTLITPFSPNIYFLMVARFFACFFIPGSTLASFTLLSEVVGTKKRVQAGILLFITVPFAFCLIVPQAYYIQDWRMLAIACSIPYIPLLAFYNFIPESLKWLCVQGRTDEVMDVVKRITRWNNKELSPNITVSPPPVGSLENTTSMVDIFRTRRLAMRSFIIGYVWLITGMGYYGLLMAANDLGGNVYMDFLIMSVSDVFSSFLAIYLCERLGRKVGTLLPTFLSGILCLIVAFIPTTPGVMAKARVACGIGGYFMMSMTYNSVHMWTIELFPTQVRSKGLGWCEVNTRTGSALAPWISQCTASLGRGAPFITLGLPVVIGVLLGLKLPKSPKLSVHPINKSAKDLEQAGVEESVIIKNNNL